MEQFINTRVNSDAVCTKQDVEVLRRENEALNNKLNELIKESNQFSYIVSHDLQAPLRMITGFLELLEKKYGDKLDDSAKQYIDFAVKGAAKMKSLIFGLLDYSRLSSLPKEFADVDLNDVLEEVREKFSSTITAANIQLSIGPLPIINADRKQMLQLFYHLVDNAVKFHTETGDIKVEIAATKNDDKWVITVNDNGIGIDPAFSEKIFIVFRRLYSDESKYKGIGIGLAMCKRIAELHGGTIKVESVPGEGSTFIFLIPIQQK